MRIEIRDVDDLERHLLRKGVSALAQGRAECADCGRTPLTGERVHEYDGGFVCSLCRPLRREAPLRSQQVRGVEHGHAVRAAVRAAA
jgi:hypothetical protein